MNLKEMLVYISISDIHPPLSYIVDWLVYKVAGPNEFPLILPSILFTAFSACLAALITYRLTNKLFWAFLIIPITILHANTLLYGFTLRWYPLWTFSALTAVYALIIETKNTRTNLWNLLLLFISLTICLYTNYQTVFLISAFIPAYFSMLIFNKFSRRLKTIFRNTLFVSILSVAAFFPWIAQIQQQFINFKNTNIFLAGTFLQTPYSLFNNCYYFYASLFGSALYPWNTMFLIISAPLMMLSIVFLISLKIKKISLTFLPSVKSFFCLAGFIVISFALFSILTQSHSARGNTLSSILFIISAIVLLDRILPLLKKNKTTALAGILAIFLFFALILSGSYNVLQKKHLHKMAFSDPVYTIMDIISSECDNVAEPIYIITVNTPLSYYLLWKHIRSDIQIVTPFSTELPSFIAETQPLHTPYSPARLILVESYLGAFKPLQEQWDEALRSIDSQSEKLIWEKSLEYDPDFRFKQKFFPRSGLSQYRFCIKCYSIPADFDYSCLENITSLNRIWKKSSDSQ